MDGRPRLLSRLMTHSCQSAPNFAVVHNAAARPTMWYWCSYLSLEGEATMRRQGTHRASRRRGGSAWPLAARGAAADNAGDETPQRALARRERASASRIPWWIGPGWVSSRVGTWPSNTAGRMANTTNCLRWPRNWCTFPSPYLLRSAANRPLVRPRRRRLNSRRRCL